jgi:hypothetical protein
MRVKLGTAQAITATAHKIARILNHVLSTKEPYAEMYSTVATNRHDGEPKCAFANRQLDLASNSCLSQQQDNEN